MYDFAVQISLPEAYSRLTVTARKNSSQRSPIII